MTFLLTLSSFSPAETFYCHLNTFYYGPDVSRAMVMWPPCWKVTDHLIEQTRTNMSQHGQRLGTAMSVIKGMFWKLCGVGKIFKHYGVSHGSVPCRPLGFFCWLLTLVESLVISLVEIWGLSAVMLQFPQCQIQQNRRKSWTNNAIWYPSTFRIYKR